MLGIQHDMRTSGKFITSHDVELPGCLVVSTAFSVSHGSFDSFECRGPVHAHARGPVCWAAFVFSLLSLAGYFLD